MARGCIGRITASHRAAVVAAVGSGLQPPARQESTPHERVPSGARTLPTAQCAVSALRSMLEDDPNRYAQGMATMLEKGDARALGMLERLFAKEEEHELPGTVAEIQAMDTDELIALIAQLDAELGVSGAAPTRQVLARTNEEGQAGNT
jgi:hypothetical protein